MIVKGTSLFEGKQLHFYVCVGTGLWVVKPKQGFVNDVIKKMIDIKFKEW